jgi:Ca2+-binding RTX toxin-like protein
MARYTGTAGNDTRTGSQNQNNQFVNYGEGEDTLTGGNRNDRFELTVDEFRDHVEGRNGVDTVDYTNADRGVSIDLQNGTTTAQFFYQVEGGPGGHPASGWEEKIVTELRNVENAIGSQFDDTLVGSNGNNVLEGGGGADHIYGGAGSDTVSYEHSGEGVTVTLNDRVELGFTTLYIPGQGHGGDAEGDRLWQIENVIGSGHEDTLTGNRDNNVFTGGAGNDTFIFSHRIGHDTITDFDATGRDHDILQISHFDSFEELREHAVARGNDVVITIDDNNSITLEDVRLNQLDENDFYFI